MSFVSCASTAPSAWWESSASVFPLRKLHREYFPLARQRRCRLDHRLDHRLAPPRALPVLLVAHHLVALDVPLPVEAVGAVQAVVEQRRGDGIASTGAGAGRVTIPRRRAESMLVDAYREKLAGMTDAEVSRLFEIEVLKEFPSGELLSPGGGDRRTDRDGGDRELERERERERERGDGRRRDEPSSVSPSPAPMTATTRQQKGPQPPGETERVDETASLLGMQRSDDKTGTEAPSPSTNPITSLFGDVQDPKDVAVPVMGTGALVLGVALIYKLISTLSGRTGGEEQTAGGVAAGNTDGNGTSVPLPPPGQDPYLMYEQSDGQGEVIWQRQGDAGDPRPLERRAPSTTATTTEDPWRTPMNGGSPVAGRGPRSPEMTAEKPVIPSAPKDVLDNAEGLQRVRRAPRS